MPLHYLKKIMVFSLLFCFIISQTFAQTRRITGKVTNEKGEPVAGATIQANGSGTGTSTDEKGEFALTVRSNARTLQISNIGYTTATVVIGASDQVSVSLAPENSTLNDVVVVGYGTARRKDITGAVSSISSKDFNQGVVTTPMDAIQGKVPGLVVTKPDGDPNSNPIIRLRGQTSLIGQQAPLIVVDGIILDNYEMLSSIPPADIATFDFLKDASAASIYGSRGANGVILITTRKGKAGSIRLSYDGYGTLSKDAKYFALLNRDEYLKLAPANSDQGGNSDWQKAITQTGYTQSHSLGLSGGTGGFTYNGSVYYQDQKGIVINTGRKQLGVRLNLDQKAFNDKLDVQVNVLNTQTIHDNVDANIFYWAYNILPVTPEKVDGLDNPIYNYNYLNPIWVQNNEYKKATDNLNQQSITVNYELLKGLKIGAFGNVSKFNTQYDYYLPTIPGAGTAINNNAFRYTSNNNSQKGDLHINYSGNFGKSSVTATGVYEYNYYEDDNYSASGAGFLVDGNQYNALQSGINSLQNISSYKEEFKLISFLARVTYNYDNRYSLTASIRRDGSSKFGPNYQNGYFPAVSAAWRISQEKFLKDVSWIDELKINAGYGVTGNSDAIGAYNTLLLLGGSVHTYDPTNQGNPWPVGYTPIQNPNTDLRWEERVGQNLGVEFSFLKSRITGGVSVFNDKTKNMLYNYGVQTPPNFIGSVLANVGSMTNKGVELGINVAIIRQKDIDWTVGGQITTVHTRVTSLSGTWEGNPVATDHINTGAAGGQGLSFNPLTYLQVGYTPNVFYLPHFVGIDQSGNQLLDSAGVGKVGINGNPTYYYVDPAPKFTYGINTGFRFRSWNLSAAFNGDYGQKIYDNARLNLANYASRFPGLNVLKEAFTNGLKDAPTTSDYWLEKASFLRLQSLTIGYTFPHVAGLENLRVYASGNNLFVITPYKGLDPEISPVGGAGGTRANIGNLATSIRGPYGGLGGAGSGQAYIDNNYAGSGFYPRARSFTIGVSVTVK
ncbi:MAG: SusC/RagA family TonB-linked outer membrane protein [Chitinophagales bacterium]